MNKQLKTGKRYYYFDFGFIRLDLKLISATYVLAPWLWTRSAFHRTCACSRDSEEAILQCYRESSPRQHNLLGRCHAHLLGEALTISVTRWHVWVLYIIIIFHTSCGIKTPGPQNQISSDHINTTHTRNWELSSRRSRIGVLLPFLL